MKLAHFRQTAIFQIWHISIRLRADHVDQLSWSFANRWRFRTCMCQLIANKNRKDSAEMQKYSIVSRNFLVLDPHFEFHGQIIWTALNVGQKRGFSITRIYNVIQPRELSHRCNKLVAKHWSAHHEFCLKLTDECNK